MVAALRYCCCCHWWKIKSSMEVIIDLGISSKSFLFFCRWDSVCDIGERMSCWGFLLVFAIFPKESQDQSDFLSRYVSVILYFPCIWMNKCALLFVLDGSWVFGFWNVFFLLSLKKVSIPETVLMYLRYYSKITVRLSGNVKMETVNLRTCVRDYGFPLDTLWGIGTEEQSLDLTGNNFWWRVARRNTDHGEAMKGEEVTQEM